MHHVQGSGVRAVLSLQFSNGAVFSGLRARGLPLVVINNSGFQDRLDSVCVDDFQGAYEGTRFLLSLGHRSVAFVEYARPESPDVVADRFVGFRKALEEQRIGFSPERRVTVPFMEMKKLEKKLALLFTRAERPTAIFAHDDYLGLYVIEVLRRIGLSVPADVSLVAPGDLLDYSLPADAADHDDAHRHGSPGQDRGEPAVRPHAHRRRGPPRAEGQGTARAAGLLPAAVAEESE